MFLYFFVARQHEHYMHELQKEIEELDLVKSLQLSLIKVVMPANDYLISGGGPNEPDNFRGLSAEVENIIARLDTLEFDEPEARELFNHIKQEYSQVKEIALQIFSIPNAVGNIEAGRLMEKMDKVAHNTVNDAEKFHQFAHHEIEKVEEAWQTTKNLLNFILSGGVLLNIGLILGSLVFFRRTIAKPIVSLKNIALEVGRGNLDKKVGIRLKDEIGDLGISFNKMIDDLRSTREELISAKRYTDSIIADLIDTLIVISPDGRIKTVNRAVLDLLGYKEQELIGRDVGIIFAEEKIFKEIIFQRLIKEGSLRNYELSYKAKDNSLTPMLFSGSVMRDKDGRMLGIVAVAKDITERKKAEETLKRSYEFFRVVLDSMNDAISIIDVNNFKIVGCNAVFLEDLGLKEEEVIGRACYEVTHQRTEPCVAPENICPLKETIATGKHSVAEHLHYKKNGEKVYVEVSTSPIKDETGKVIQVVHVARDITERKRINEQLQRAYIKLRDTQQQLIQAEKLSAVGVLASGIAHEVKNPLGIIIQGVNYLEKKVSPKQKDTFKILKMIKDSVRRADDIIRSLLDFSRIKDLSLQSEDINSILEESLSLVKQRFKFEHIQILKQMKQDMPKVLVDRNRMEQVFINLFLNAIQSMPEGGRIIVRSYTTQLAQIKNGVGRRVGDHFRLKETAVIVEIEDSGIGIPKENLKKIFDPFFTTKGPRGGAGLGLSVCRNIIDIHRGLIEVESQIGKGTKITITLKIVKEKKNGKEKNINN
jgi:PAS domain S-box-containing protein